MKRKDIVESKFFKCNKDSCYYEHITHNSWRKYMFILVSVYCPPECAVSLFVCLFVCECVSVCMCVCVCVCVCDQIRVPAKNHITCQTSVNLTPCCIKQHQGPMARHVGGVDKI